MKLGNIENDNDFKCTFCNAWSGKNKASLAAHIRNCKLNPKNKEFEVIIPEIIPEPIIVAITPPANDVKVKKNKAKQREHNKK